MTIRVYSEHVESTAGALSFYNTLSNSFILLIYPLNPYIHKPEG